MRVWGQGGLIYPWGAMFSPHVPLQRRQLLLTLGALLVIGLTLLGWFIRREQHAPRRILLVTPRLDLVTAGLNPGEERALGALAQEQLEYLGGHAVTTVTQLPEDLRSIQGRRGLWVVVLEPRRIGDQLQMAYRAIPGRRIHSGQPLAWERHEGAPMPPAQAMDDFLRGFPVPVAAPKNSLVPTSTEVFWSLMRASALRLRNEGLEEATLLAERATQQEPTCATSWLLLGNLHYRQTLNNPSAFRRERAETEALFQRALMLAPHHPRAAFLLALIYSDAGNHREALDLLLAARKRQPHNPTLLTGIAYAGRGAGLLPLSRRAMDLRDDLALAQFTPQALDITCLYTGEVARFEASLREQPGHLRSTGGVLPFYRGYLALLRNQTNLAHEEFHRAAALSNGYPNMQRLADIYDLILEDRKSEALQAVKAFDQERVGMQEPDGEFTIRLAEAYALIGDRGTAMEMCARAFARGFGCTEWYEKSPLLASLRDLPRWKSLIQHLKERQGLMQDRFPMSVLDA